MNLYFFVNHLLKSSTRKFYIYNRDKYKDIKKFYNLRTHRDFYDKLSYLILNESKNEKSKNQSLIYCELLSENRIFNKLIVKENRRFTEDNIRYLILLVNHYYLDNHPVVLLNDLMDDQLFFVSKIVRITNYPIFRDWITIKHYLNVNKRKLQKCNYYESDLYHIFLMELNRTQLIKLIEY